MAEEVKPIKKERIDNPDGTYTIKEIYKEHPLGILSSICIFDNLDRQLSGQGFVDDNFQELNNTWQIEYENNGNYKYIVLSRKNPLGSLKYNKDFYSYITYYNQNNQLIKTDYYKDKHLKYILESHKYEYKNNGAFNILEYIYTYNQDCIDDSKTCLKIEYFDDKNRWCGEEWYYDKDKQKLNRQTKREYKEDGSYIDFDIYEEAIEEMGNSNIEYSSSKEYNSYDGTEKYMELFSDKNFCNLIITKKTVYNDDFFEVFTKGKLKYDDIEYNSRYEKYNCKESEPAIFKYYSDKDFKELLFTVNFFIGVQGEDSFDMVDYILYEPICNKEYLSEIKCYYKSVHNCVHRERFKDNNFKEKLV